MLGRVLTAVLVGFVAAIVSAIVIFVIAALVPGFSVDVWKWAGLLGLLSGLVYLFTGKTPGELG